MFSQSDRRNNNSKSMPPELIGTWKVEGSSFQFEITDTCALHRIGTPDIYSISDPNTLIFGSTYTRVYGEPGSLIGVWWSEEQQEEKIFRENNTYSIYFTGGEVLSGIYTATETHITSNELFALLEVNDDGKHMTELRPFDHTVYGTFEIESPKRWYFRSDNGWVRTCYRD